MSYWKQKLAAAPASLELPTDFPRLEEGDQITVGPLSGTFFLD